ncbi:NAD-specific glutamate dehydrogenase, large form [Liberibacter crescens BT-1]|uniref:NAD-specific glutamate dehydrogenase, large form n=1 Tax=Liberibacter crescens (strain BT-1) TaxID=1215343 RepID=L0EW85_LIBCB|nr:NAD-glutamate dehydrogenase domain-containing protein [Liberibacter crescens]AGA65222.1 NAD-specific glutamate dehydrogenase, large form [Liberibacter crescens BT-1]
MVSRDLKRDRIIEMTEGEISRLGYSSVSADVLLGRAILDDLKKYTPSMLALVCASAYTHLKNWDFNEPYIDISEIEGVTPSEKAVSIITIVAANIPYLYQSVMAEITSRRWDLMLAVHPVLVWKNDCAPQLYSPFESQENSTQMSFIQIHVTKISHSESLALKEKLPLIVRKVRLVAKDSEEMLAQLDKVSQSFMSLKAVRYHVGIDEALEFLNWLRDGNFKIFGMRHYTLIREKKSLKLKSNEQTGLGILTDPEVFVFRFCQETPFMTPEVCDFLEGPDLLIIAKSNLKSIVSGKYVDYIGIKCFDPMGKVIGELRIVGLFTYSSYLQNASRVPLLRAKIVKVKEHFGFDPASHYSRVLQNTLDYYPRDDLFQIDPILLSSFCEQINELSERPHVRVLPRIDRFNRFVSILVYVFREDFNSVVCEKIGDYFSEVYEGHVSAIYPSFLEEPLTRIHFIIGRSGGRTPRPSQEKLETVVASLVTRWEEKFKKLAGAGAPSLLVNQAFRDIFSPEQAVDDLKYIITCASGKEELCIRFLDKKDNSIQIKIFHADNHVSLSRRVPLLENLGFTVISEDTFKIGVVGKGGQRFVILYQMELEPAANSLHVDLGRCSKDLVEAFKIIFQGRVDDDLFNRLVILSGLRVYEVNVLRSYARYFRQTSITLSQDFIALALNKNPLISKLIFLLFRDRFDPILSNTTRKKRTNQHLKEINKCLLLVPNLDEDNVLRRYVNLIMATVRTNYFQNLQNNGLLSFKLDPSKIDTLVEPRPFREIFVYGPEVEGVHLRFGRIARGGLRWSDRAEDYRTEALGLVKAQRVKNAVIVPVGAKGCFYPRKLPIEGSRNEIFNAGHEAYKIYIRALLSLTDNIENQRILPPPNIIRLDDDDPYFVVAADKGTATFSDTANKLAKEMNFWLEDAFASGGSSGYDHKKMGITARGAWEAVKRHFREMNIDIQSMPFTVVGIGDMSGDVFGNGMLLSKKIKLIAAFDHRDIFIDPDPDMETTFSERNRIFKLSSSSWQDFNLKILSQGGMIISRKVKSVKLTPEAAHAIGMSKIIVTPFEIMSAILKAPVDLLWFGGIGTYISSPQELDVEVGDPANNLIRVSADQVQAKVIGEGANLGVTQQGRIVYALNGGRINSDAIDNSGGVNSSDLEVNIKIALASAMRDGKLTLQKRNRLLISMTSEVIDIVLRNNYLQSLAISLEQRRGISMMREFSQLINVFEEEGVLNRQIENLPDANVFKERCRSQKPLTRPEIGVLLSYAKLTLSEHLMQNDLIDDPWFLKLLFNYFPLKMHKLYANDIINHQLKREIIAAVLANAIINYGGPCFAVSLAKATDSSPVNVVRAATIAYEGYGLESLWMEVDSLDNKISGEFQNRIYEEIRFIFKKLTYVLIKNKEFLGSIDTSVKKLSTAFHKLNNLLTEKVPVKWLEDFNSKVDQMIADQVPHDLAKKIVQMQFLIIVPDLIEISEKCKATLFKVLEMWCAVSESFYIDELLSKANKITVEEHYENLALSAEIDWVYSIRHKIISKALITNNSVIKMLQEEEIQKINNKIAQIIASEKITPACVTIITHLLSDILLKIE